MGCNAWNHPADCDCGWGGRNGGGGGRGGGGGTYRSLRVADGFTWRLDGKPSYESFVNPNASCPVCGASVYFYQSPSGGRVFFDELGPPWPKHPCTDTSTTGVSRLGHDFIFGPVENPVRKTPQLKARGTWRPLLVEELARVGDFDRIAIPRTERLPGKYVYVPMGWIGDAPSYWRWSPEDPGAIEISGFRLGNDSDLETRSIAIPNWLNGDKDFQRWQLNQDAELSAETLTAIGFAHSFAWRIPSLTHWYQIFPVVDLELGRTYFEKAAEKGYWVAQNNLAVMYRDGLVDRF